MTTSTAATSPAPAESQAANVSEPIKAHTAASKPTSTRAPRSAKSATAPQKAKVSPTVKPVKTAATKAATPAKSKPVAPKTKTTKAQASKPVATPPATTKAETPKKKAVKAVKAVKVEKEKKVKVVRDSFTIPKAEFTQLADMKKRAMGLGVEVKKSELIRAGLQLLSGLQDAAFKKALSAVPTIKTGRPSKD